MDRRTDRKKRQTFWRWGRRGKMEAGVGKWLHILKMHYALVSFFQSECECYTLQTDTDNKTKKSQEVTNIP